MVLFDLNTRCLPLRTNSWKCGLLTCRLFYAKYWNGLFLHGGPDRLETSWSHLLTNELSWELETSFFSPLLIPSVKKKKKRKLLDLLMVWNTIMYSLHSRFFGITSVKVSSFWSDRILAICICFPWLSKKPVIAFFFLLGFCFTATQCLSQRKAWVFVPLKKKVAVQLNISTKIQLWLLHEIVLIWKPQRKTHMFDWYNKYLFNQEEWDYNYV